MIEEEIAKAIGLGENDDYEFKDNRRGVGESILTTVSAFANSLGGVIICGVVSKDDEATHEVVGLANAKKHKDDLWNTLNNKQSISYPSVSSGDIWVKAINGKDLVCVRVKPADRRYRPVYVGKNPLVGTYKRGGTGDYRCTEDEVRQMLRDATADPQDATVFGGTTFDEIDPATFAAYRNVLAANRPGHPDLRSNKIDFVNTPPPERRWLQITAQSRIGPPSADSSHIEVVVWFRRGLVLDVFGPHLISHVATARNPVASRP
jgi:ATP-dependent DNA helicase RecG